MAKSKARPPYLILSGTEEFLRAEALDILLSGMGEDPEVWEVGADEFAAADDPAILVFDELRTSSLFGSNKVVRIPDAASFLAAASDVLARFAKAGASDSVLVLEGAELVKKKGRTFSKNALMKTLEAHGAVFVDCSPLGSRTYGYGKPEWDSELTRWVVERFESQGKVIAPPIAMVVHQRDATGLRGLNSEIQKICLHLGERPEVFLPDVQEVMGEGDEATLFEVVDAFGERDFRRTLTATDRLYRGGLREKDGAKNFKEIDISARLMPLLARRLRELGRITEFVHSGMDFDEAAAIVLGSGRRWLFGRMQTQFRSRKGPELADAVLGLSDTEFHLKTSRGRPRDLLLEYLSRHSRRPQATVSDNPFAGRRRP